MASKKSPAVQHLRIGEERPYAGFLLDSGLPGWHLLHFWSGELVLNGYMLIPHEVVREIRPEENTGVYCRLQKVVGIAPQDPGLTGNSMQDLLQNLSSKWPLVIIYRKQYGLSELDVGRIDRIEEDRFHYRAIAPNGDEQEPSSLVYDEILLLAFGDSYTEMLGKILEYRSRKKSP